MPWQPPAKLPTPGDLRDAIQRCNLTTEGRVTSAYAKLCFAKLVMAFEPNTKLSGDEGRLRMAVWLEACGDLNDVLWADATAQAIQTMKWMPKPAEFRAFVMPQVDKARKRKMRLEAMIEATRRPSTQTAFVRESDAVRTKGLRDSFRKVGDLAKAAGYERMVASDEGRPVEEWALGDIPPRPAPAADPLAPALPAPSLAARIALTRASITFWRDMGIEAVAVQKERELAALETEAMAKESSA